MTANDYCLVRHPIWGDCPECHSGFPQWCRGRGGIPKRKPQSVPPHLTCSTGSTLPASQRRAWASHARNASVMRCAP